jgi:ATP-dependent RNA helicase TDRD9
VNSVAIEDETHSQTQRMMVAGFVGLNPSGATVIARDTTIMPLMPGLAEMITLLFAPVAEFR